MHLAIFGSSLVSSYWNGAATYYRGIFRAMSERGHAITFYEPDAFDRQAHRDMDDPRWARVVVYRPDDFEEIQRCLDEAGRADFVAKCSGVGVNDSYLEQAVAGLRGPRTTVAFWDVDAPATLERMQNDPQDSLRELVPRFDMILTYGGGPPVVDAYGQLGARTCVPIYNAVDAGTHYPVEPDPRFAGLLGFLGNRLPDREARVESFFLDVATQLPEQRFVLGGNGWDERPLPGNVHAVGHVYTRDHNAFNCTPRAVLNIARDSMARFGFSPATRVFEACGAGACLVTDRWLGLEQFLAPGHEVLVVDHGAQLADLLRDLTPERAKAVGHAGRRRVLSEHTYTHRAEQLEALLKRYCPRPVAERPM